MYAIDTKKKAIFLEGKGQATKQYHMPKVQRSAFQEMVFTAFKCFWRIMNGPSLLKIAKRGKQ